VSDPAVVVNAHTHLYSGLAPLGMPAPHPEPANFLEILQRVWWRLDRAHDALSLHASARLYASETMLHGTFAVVDHHESPSFIEGSLDVIADACQEAGLRAVLCYGASERNGGWQEARRGLEECRRFVRENRRPLVRGVVGLHAGFTVSDDTIREAVRMAHELDSVLHLHVAEDRVDVLDARARGYAGVVDRLERLGALLPGSILAHGVHLSEAEVRRCGQAGCWLVQNPRSNRGNRVGYPAALKHSERVALGTDGYPSEMSLEEEALLEEATAAGDDLASARKRLAAGALLLAERFGAAATATEVAEWERAREALHHKVTEIRAHAIAHAARLWKRMAAVA